jgi:hypothetical protein
MQYFAEKDLVEGFKTVKTTYSAWIPVEREVKIPLAMDTTPLKVKTTSQLGSQDLLKIKLYNEDGTWRTIQLKFTNPMSYLIGSCTNFIPFSDPPQNHWVFIRTLHGVKYVCNGVKVLDFNLSNQVCTSRFAIDWEVKWSMQVVAVFFDAEDAASQFYGFKISK